MRHLSALALLGCVILLITACGGGNANNILTISDTSPSKIDVNVSLSLNNSGIGRNYLHIITSQDHVWVAMNHGETMVCNGVKLALDPDKIGFVASDFPLDTPTPPITCFYYSGHQQASFTFTPVSPPQLLTPQEGAMLNHVQPLTVTYSAGKGVLIRAMPSVQNGGKTDGGNSLDKPDNGSITLDMHGLHSGKGFIQIIRFMEERPNNTGFRSFVIDYDTTTLVNVTWI